MRQFRHLVPGPLAVALVVACGLVSTAVAADQQAPVEIEAAALDTRIESRVEADQAMDGAVAASVIGAISTQFGERKVAVKLDEVAVRPASVRDRSVSGIGRLQIGKDHTWIPFQFDVLYDTATASASFPAITLGDAAGGTEIALDSGIARELGQRADDALADEFAQQPVQLVVNRVTTTDAGERYMVVEAMGIADFAAEGTTPTQIEALYDRQTGEWLRLDYELGTTSNWADDLDPSVATR